MATWSHNRPHFVYLLMDAKTLEVRYVGLTQHPGERLASHATTAIHRAKVGRVLTPVQKWITDIYERGSEPTMKVVARKPNRDEGAEAERAEIRRQLRKGAPLLNRHGVRGSLVVVGLEEPKRGRRKAS